MEVLISCAYLNHAASADSSFFSGDHFDDFHCLEEGPHWTYLLSISLQFFTIGFSVGIESLNRDACSTCAPVCASTCTKIFILSLIVCYLGFPLLSTFHPLAVKFAFVYKKNLSLQENQI
jgi:hypothetical protein